jgi:rubrerythrin
MTPVEALQVALTTEKSSIDLYERMARRYPEVRELAELLVIEEQKHKKMIEEKIVEMTRY